MQLSLLVKEITDTYVRENFQRIKDWATRSALFRMDPQFFEIQVPVPAGATSVGVGPDPKDNFLFPHRLGYTPRDILMTSAIGSGTITWNYAKFDSTNLNLSITGITPSDQATVFTIRVLVGNYS